MGAGSGRTGPIRIWTDYVQRLFPVGSTAEEGIWRWARQRMPAEPRAVQTNWGQSMVGKNDWNFAAAR